MWGIFFWEDNCRLIKVLWVGIFKLEGNFMEGSRFVKLFEGSNILISNLMKEIWMF